MAGSSYVHCEARQQENIFPATFINPPGKISAVWHNSEALKYNLLHLPMTRIALLSDTHGYLDPQLFTHLKSCHEVWHAGDFGNLQLARELEQESGLPLKGVYGNIDGTDIRAVYPEENCFTCEQVVVFMKHIAGYPGRYAPGVKARLKETKAGLFISGHSHILKVQFDPELNCLHMNPGAAGKQGWHQVRTMIRFEIHEKEMRNCEVIELGKRG